MLQIERLTTKYGSITALNRLSIEVRQAEIVAIIGPNGAGKTTLLNTISGIIKPSGGRILFHDQDITGWPPHRVVSAGISQVPERRQVFESLSVRDNLLLGAYQRMRLDGRAAIERDLEQVLEIFPVLKDRLGDPAGTLSGGMQQMLAIGRGLMASPKLLLLDEPSLGLAPLLVREIFRVIVELRRAGRTVLLVEQNARAALRVADRGYVLENGGIALQGTALELARDEGVQRAYLGKRSAARMRGLQNISHSQGGR